MNTPSDSNDSFYRSKDVLLVNPIPLDVRFELSKADITKLSTVQVTSIPALDKHSPRPELFKVPKV